MNIVALSPCDFLQAVEHSDRGTLGARAAQLVGQLGPMQAVAGGDENVVSFDDSRGGFLAPTEFTTELLTRAWDFSKVAARCSTIPVKGFEMKAPMIRETSRVEGSRLGGVRSYWLSESFAIPSSQFKAQQLALRPRKRIVMIPASEELVADAPAFEEFVFRVGSEELAVSVDDAVINGTSGAGPMLQDASVVTVAKDEDQDAGTITAGNVANMMSRLWPYSDGNAAWFCSKSAESAMMADANLWHMLRFAGPDAPAGTPRFSLLGAPVIPIEQCQPVGTPGDLILADCSQYILGSRAPQMIRSIHVRFVNHESMFKIWFDVDGKVSWEAPVTPMRDTSGLTQSPFVVLAPRS